ncbi:hypothetical protein Trydic_g2214 [Trypoxylus dichotomus]
MANNNQQNFYTNPAFCQQSEYYNPHQQQQQQNCRSPPRPKTVSVRHPPVGAQTRIRIRDGDNENGNDCYEEQEFYEEMIVDDSGLIKEKKLVIVSSAQENSYSPNHRYEYIDDDVDKKVNRYEQIQQNKDKPRCEYIPLKRQESTKGSRYATIPTNKESDGANSSGRYALVPIEDLSNHRYAVITEDDIKAADRYEYIAQPPLENPPPYNEFTDKRRQTTQPSIEARKMVSPRKANPAATQKLHELLSTPRKTQIIQNPPNSQRILSPQSPRKNISPQHQRDLFITPNKTPPKIVRSNSRAQQKLNYAIGTRQSVHHQDNKRHTAIVAPICSSPVQSVYSETTFSQKTESWMNLSVVKPPVQATLAVAAVMMLLCGGVSFGLSLYMISLMGRLYYLDFGTVAGFTCLILGLMGFRTRNCYWLPNRNYISGYIVLSVFSLLSCVGLLILLFMRPKPGTPLADMTSGAVCCISVISLLLATAGVISSYCCKYPPPDNRVQHCARGFTV